LTITACRSHVYWDDVALKDTISRECRRGIAGAILAHKVADAAAEAGMPLEGVARSARL